MAEAHVAELDEFVAEPHRHLRAAWRRDVPLLVIAHDGQRLVVDTLADLETVQYAQARAQR